jgi:hypothetical protein
MTAARIAELEAERDKLADHEDNVLRKKEQHTRSMNKGSSYLQQRERGDLTQEQLSEDSDFTI